MESSPQFTEILNNGLLIDTRHSEEEKPSIEVCQGLALPVYCQDLSVVYYLSDAISGGKKTQSLSSGSSQLTEEMSPRGKKMGGGC